MIKTVNMLVLGSLALAAPAFAKPPPQASFTGQELSGAAKVSLDQARAKALKARPGQIVDQELEKEAGGSGLRYAFDVKSHGVTYEVGVDAKTGKIVENAAESAAKEAQEVKQEPLSHHGGVRQK